MSGNRRGLVSLAGVLALATVVALESCHDQGAVYSADASVADGSQPAVSEDGSADASLDGSSDAGVAIIHRIATLSEHHFDWDVEPDGTGLVFITSRHPDHYLVWRVPLAMSGEVDLSNPTLSFDTQWGTDAYGSSFSTDAGKEPIVFLMGMNPDRYPTRYVALLPDDSREELFSCEYAEVPVRGGSERPGEAWLGVKNDCTRRCGSPAVALFSTLDKAQVCAFPNEPEPDTLLLDPSRRLGTVHALLPPDEDGGIDTNAYLRMFTFNATGVTAVSHPLRTSVSGGFFVPGETKILYSYRNPPAHPPMPDPPDVVFEIREIEWTSSGELVERTSTELSRYFNSIDALFELDDGFAVLGQRRPNDAGVTGRLIALVANGMIERRHLPESVSGRVIIRPWHGHPYAFWERDGGFVREVLTAPVESFERE